MAQTHSFFAQIESMKKIIEEMFFPGYHAWPGYTTRSSLMCHHHIYLDSGTTQCVGDFDTGWFVNNGPPNTKVLKYNSAVYKNQKFLHVVNGHEKNDFSFYKLFWLGSLFDPSFLEKMIKNDPSKKIFASKKSVL